MIPPAGAGLPVLVVASWFPAVDDSTRGRFVADQVRALVAEGRIDPAVLSFEVIQLAGSRAYRQGQLDAIRALSAAAVGRDGRLFADEGMHGPAGVPVARIPVAGGWKGVVGDHGVRERELALGALEDRGGRWPVVHAHTGVPDAAAAAGFAARTGATLLITEHASFLGTLLQDPDRRAAYARSVAVAARVIAVSATLGRELAADIPGVADKLIVIPNAVDTDAFRPAPLAGRRPEELLYVGYRVETKGIGVLLRAFGLVHAARPGTTLRLIGKPVDAAAEAGWHRLVAEMGIADAVSFEPAALRPAVADAMARASVLVHASPRETFGITAVEALASGMPVVAADSGGVTETLAGDPALGELVPVNDPAAFAGAVLRTLDRREAFDPVYLRESAVRRFGAAAVATRLADLYQEVAPAGWSGGDRAPGPVRNPAHGAQTAASILAAAQREAGAPVLVVGFTTHRTARILGTLPADLRARLHVLCAAGDDVRLLPGGLAGVTPTDLEGPYRGLEPAGPAGGRPARIRAALADPVGTVRRRVLRTRAERHRTHAATSALETGMARLGPAATTLDVVAVDGLDYLVVAQVPGAAARLVPGGVRWLADRHAAVLDHHAAAASADVLAGPAGRVTERDATDPPRVEAVVRRPVPGTGRAARAWRLVRATVRRPWRAHRFPRELLRIVLGPIPAPPVRRPAVESSEAAAARRAVVAREETRRRLAAVAAAQRARPPRPLAGQRVAVIADQWLLDGLAAECRPTALVPDGWEAALEAEPPELLLVQTAWHGPQGAWQYRLAWHPYHESLRLDAVRGIAEWCRARGVPRVLWDTEPAENWPRFKALAGLVDHVAAADADAAEAYRGLPTSTAITVQVLPAGIARVAGLIPAVSGAPDAAAPSAAGPLFVGEVRTDLPLGRREPVEALLAAGAARDASWWDTAGAAEPGRLRVPAAWAGRRVPGPVDGRTVGLLAAHPVILLDGGGTRPGAAVPRLVLAALAAGTPVVTTRSPAVTALLGDLVPQGDTVAELEAAIDAALEPAHRDRVRAVAPGIARDHGLGRRLAALAAAVGLNVEPEAAR